MAFCCSLLGDKILYFAEGLAGRTVCSFRQSYDNDPCVVRLLLSELTTTAHVMNQLATFPLLV